MSSSGFPVISKPPYTHTLPSRTVMTKSDRGGGISPWTSTFSQLTVTVPLSKVLLFPSKVPRVNTLVKMLCPSSCVALPPNRYKRPSTKAVPDPIRFPGAVSGGGGLSAFSSSSAASSSFSGGMAAASGAGSPTLTVSSPSTTAASRSLFGTWTQSIFAMFCAERIRRSSLRLPPASVPPKHTTFLPTGMRHVEWRAIRAGLSPETSRPDDHLHTPFSHRSTLTSLKSACGSLETSAGVPSELGASGFWPPVTSIFSLSNVMKLCSTRSGGASPSTSGDSHFI